MRGIGIRGAAMTIALVAGTLLIGVGETTSSASPQTLSRAHLSIQPDGDGLQSDPIDCKSTGSAAFEFAEPLENAYLMVDLQLRHDMTLDGSFANAIGGYRGGAYFLVGEYYGGLPRQTLQVPDSPEGVHNATSVNLVLGARPTDTIAYCSAWVVANDYLRDETAIQCLTHGTIDFTFPEPQDDYRVPLNLALHHDMILSWELLDAAGTVLASDYRLIGQYYGGLPRQTIYLPSEPEPAVSGVTDVQVRLEARGVETIQWCSAHVLTTAPALNYVALGDSFSSGEGNPPFVLGTADDENSCHRSRHDAYPQLLKKHVDAFLFRACSGATIDDFYRARHPGQKRQLDYATLGVDLITLSIAGNDVGFAKVLKTCKLTLACQRAFPSLGGRIRAQQKPLEDLLVDIHERTLGDGASNPTNPAGATVAVLGYPHIFPSPSNELLCAGGTWGTGERRWLRRMTVELNYTIHKAAVAASEQTEGAVVFVPVLRALAGHELCEDEPWVHGLVRHPRVFSYHPNERGQQALKRRVRLAGFPWN